MVWIKPVSFCLHFGEGCMSFETLSLLFYDFGMSDLESQAVACPELEGLS